MKIVTNEIEDTITIKDLKDHEYSLLIGAVQAAASDVSDFAAFGTKYGGERGEMVKLFRDLQRAEEKRGSDPIG